MNRTQRHNGSQSRYTPAILIFVPGTLDNNIAVSLITNRERAMLHILGCLSQYQDINVYCPTIEASIAYQLVMTKKCHGAFSAAPQFLD